MQNLILDNYDLKYIFTNHILWPSEKYLPQFRKWDQNEAYKPIDFPSFLTKPIQMVLIYLVFHIWEAMLKKKCLELHSHTEKKLIFFVKKRWIKKKQTNYIVLYRMIPQRKLWAYTTYIPHIIMIHCSNIVSIIML